MPINSSHTYSSVECRSYWRFPAEREPSLDEPRSVFGDPVTKPKGQPVGDAGLWI